MCTAAEDHSKTGMSPAAYITVGVVVGAAVVLIIVAAVVVYNRRRKAINQDGSRGQFGYQFVQILRLYGLVLF